MTVGHLFKLNKVMFDKDILSIERSKLSNFIKQQSTKKQNQILQFKEKKAKCNEILTLNVPIDTLTVTQLRAVCRFKKHKLDGALPTIKQPMKERYIATLGRADLPCNEWIRKKDTNGKN